MSRLVWVAVPGGPVDGGGALLRVVIIPVLDQPLAAAGMTTWPPPSLAEARLSIDVVDDAGAAVPGVSARPTLGVVPGAWEAFFGSVDVTPAGARAQSADDAARTVTVAPTVADAGRVSAVYGAAAIAGGATATATSAEAAAGVHEALAASENARAARGARAGAAARARPARARSTTQVDANLALAMLREHPTVLRALGLVLELRLDGAALAALPARGRLRVSWADAPDDVPPADSRWTAFQRTGFRARPRAGSPLHAGGSMVRLADPTWRVVTFDPEHTLGGLADLTAGGAGELPSVRSAGLLLAHTGRQQDLEDRLARPSLSGGGQEVLWADDLVLGYRLDVRPQGAAAWSSLTARTATYAIDGITLAEAIAEEGQVKVGSAVDHGDGDLRATEVVTRWDGWSLAVPRPGSGSRGGRGRSAAPSAPYQLDSRLAVPPGSLPRLVFGGDYHLRVRVADVAGGGPTLGAQSPDGCDLRAVFQRHEAVSAPMVTLAGGATGPDVEHGPGAGLLSLVVRSPDPSAPAETASSSDAERELWAPTVPLDVLEKHGLTAPGNATDGAALADRAAGQGVRGVPDPASGGLVGWIRLPGATDVDVESLARSPDWVPQGPVRVPVGSAPWPDLPPRSLVLRARTDDAQPTLAWDDGRLVVRLDPGTEAQVEVSSYLHHGARDAFALSQWLSDAAPAAGITGTRLAELERELGEGRNPLATPARVVRLRHAVRRPLGLPAGDLTATRVESATYVDLAAPRTDPLLGVHPGSTIAVEVAASWTPREDVDDPAVAGRPVGRIGVPLGATALDRLRHELGDTKHREVTYVLTALSRFRDCFADGGTAPLEEFAVVGTLGPVSVPSSARPPAPVVRAAVPGFAWKESVAPDGTVTRQRLGNRVRLQLDSPWYASGDGERLVVLPATQAGRDPIWGTDPAPRHPHVLGPTVSVQVPRTTGRAAGGSDVDLDDPVDGVAHTAWPAADAWWVDVVLEEQPSYGALVQLVVARHQPHSTNPAIATSEPTTTDFVPILPDRTLTITPTDATVSVLLDGLRPTGPVLNTVSVSLQVPLDAIPDGTVTDLDATGRPWGTVATATVPVGDTVALDRPPGEVRVLVQELENIPSGLPDPAPFAELARRVVFVEDHLL